MPKSPRLDLDAAEAIALKGLGFLVEDPTRLARFLALTGLEPAEFRASAGRPEMLAAVLDYLLGDESLLLEFTANHAIEPSIIAPAQALISSNGRRVG